MIEVNLLPEDRRPVERTPLPRFLVIVGGVIGICIEVLIAYSLYARTQREREVIGTLRLRRDAAQKQVDAVDDFQKKIDGYNKRKREIEKLANDRRLWGPILYRLCDPEVLPPKIWFKSLRLEAKRGPRGTADTSTLVIEGYAWSTDEGDNAGRLQALRSFINRLGTNTPHFSEHFKGQPEITGNIDIVQVQKTAKSPKDVPVQALSFKISMPLQPPASTKPAAGVAAKPTPTR